MKALEMQALREEVEKALYDWDDGAFEDAATALKAFEVLQGRLPASEKDLHARLEAAAIEAAETVEEEDE